MPITEYFHLHCEATSTNHNLHSSSFFSRSLCLSLIASMNNVLQLLWALSSHLTNRCLFDTNRFLKWLIHRKNSSSEFRFCSAKFLDFSPSSQFRLNKPKNFNMKSGRHTNFPWTMNNHWFRLIFEIVQISQIPKSSSFYWQNSRVNQLSFVLQDF